MIMNRITNRERYFRVGFSGATTDEALDWSLELLAARTPAVDTVVLPFTGSGKDVAAFAQAGYETWSWDTQIMSDVLVGVMRAPWAVHLDTPYGIPGYAKENFPISEIDEGSAQLLNYIAARGNVHERAALVKVLFRSTAMGRLTQWGGNVDGYRDVWNTFLRARDSLEPWANISPRIHHTLGSCLEAPFPAECDVIYIDPPKVLERTDLYSGKGYTGLNSILAQQQFSLPQWRGDTYLARIQQILSQTNWRLAVLFHASGLVPTLNGMLAGMPVEPSSIKEFSHESRIDYAIVMER